MGKSTASVLIQGFCSSRPACGRRRWESEIPLKANKKTEDESWSEVMIQRPDTSFPISVGAVGGCEETVPIELILPVLTLHCISAAQRHPESKLFEQNDSA